MSVEKFSKEWFEQRSKQQGDCLIWQNGKHVQGYGMVRDGARMRSTVQVLGQKKFGVITHKDSKLKYTTSCGNPDCVNIDHIVQISGSKLASIRNDSRGFSSDEIRAIRKEHAETPDYWGKSKEMAEKLGISAGAYSHIINRHSYKGVK